ncbi:hypothetical protein [Bradyrhizobium niftali]|uniref:Uncharacterized protein n=1 Tax=Bradyrhizobium niftali TaxID=2560055 RepID=A0A4Y9LZJ7_9BRAD|nr:hypothetical protein [Bradyrhizobium niftali]TFV48334.1 hypothetical protein E4K65_13130 [Bradyrhizobium niftali]
MSVSQVRSAANTAALACAFLSLREFGAIATAGVRLMHEATAMLGPQMNQHIAGALSLVRDCGSLAGVKEILSRAAGWNHPPQAPAYPPTADVQTLAACQQARAYRARVFEFTPKRHPLGSADRHGQA